MDAAKVSTHLFPGDVVVDIMARLPVKSLKRFRSVAKSWCSLIQSREFVSAHYSHSKNKVCPLIMRRDYNKENTIMVSSVSNHTLDVVTNFDIPTSFTSTTTTTHISVLGCCNGILCLSNGANGSVALWNLATTEIKILPSCPLEHPEFWCDAIGFGHDSERDDFKVVRIDTCWDPSLFDISRVALYDFSTDSWRGYDVTFRFDFELLCQRDKRIRVYSNGFYHFWGSVDHKEMLLSFNFSKEIFITTPYPDTSCSFCSLMEIHGSLDGLCYHEIYVSSSSYEVWVLGEIGVKNSWTKLFTTQHISVGFYPLVADSNGELIFASNRQIHDESDHGYEFLVCHQQDPCSKQEALTTKVHGLVSCLELEMYSESLVSLL